MDEKGYIFNVPGVRKEWQERRGEIMAYKPQNCTPFREKKAKVMYIYSFLLNFGRKGVQDQGLHPGKMLEHSSQTKYELLLCKRKYNIPDAMDDKEGSDKAAVKRKQRQRALNDFVAKTGRTMRVDRTQVFGYNRSVAGRVTQSVKPAGGST